MTLYLTASSFYSIFTQVPKTLSSTEALQEGFLKSLGDVATVLLDLFCLSFFCFFMSFQTDWWWSDQISGCCQTPCANKNLTGVLKWMAKWMFGNVNWYFLLTLQQKIIITDLNPCLAGENTSVVTILATTVWIYIYIYMATKQFCKVKTILHRKL